jgi:hypothetical protein
MIYLKNSEIAQKYHISLGTVRNWISSAQNGKLGITLMTVAGKPYVANTSHNIMTIESLIEGNKKYRPNRAKSVLSPDPAFYQLFNQEQIYDIVTNLEVRREIPRSYEYFDGGATSWDELIQRMDRENAPSHLTVTREQLRENREYLDRLTAKRERLNVVDIGVGNAMPVNELLGHLLRQNRLGRYIAIDISPDMLQIAKKNIENWFGGRVEFEGHRLDISRDRFTHLLAPEYIDDASHKTANLILFLGGTLANFRNRDVPLNVINDSMGTNDYLIHSQKLDTTDTRKHFDFNSTSSQEIPPIHDLIVKLLRIDPSLYDLEVGYDSGKRERYERIRLKSAITIQFDFENGHRSVGIDKGEALTLWRFSQDTAVDVNQLFDRNDFYILQSSQTEDRQYILTISKVKQPSA